MACRVSIPSCCCSRFEAKTAMQFHDMRDSKRP
uniref:Uncharacterized protein n=1 Tax=Siphoviridae sp. ct6YY1 TaxID=2825343 RepID=A0A8S5V3D5_9CAUD|nr:MAG TPA: hypothetical protein [Siphoviridae sp. ct6YY1]